MTPNDTRAAELREAIEELRTHYERICLFCGETWLGLHCPHDGYQNPCPNCGKMPETISTFDTANDCNGVIDTDEIVVLTARQILEGQIRELEPLLPEMTVEDYGLWVRIKISNRIAELKSQLRAVGGGEG